ncbi:MFS general substrate transporter [Thozetella sp. PMI_491]|nr:MFS general substrate transporter [Thozetella sp. PMI_491]
MPAADEDTPLLGEHHSSNGNGTPHAGRPKPKEPRRFLSPATSLLVAGFMISTSFCFTQVPILFLLRQMVCDDYYSIHPPFEGPGDRCNLPQIDGPAAQQMALLGMSTTICGTVNLFMAGWYIKRVGLKTALAAQTALPALRVAIQTVGAIVGGRAGIVIFQTSQLMTVLGGPAGYMLVLNTYMSELVTPAERTAAFGRLQGVAMLGTATGFLVGSIIGDIYDVILPFKVAFCSFVLSCLYVAIVPPYISPESMSGAGPPVKGLGGFFAPLKILVPQDMTLPDGKQIKSRGILFLTLGVFLGVLATGYAPILIQMYAMNRFGFRPAENGSLMALNFVARGIFLMVVFPAIISSGRAWFARTEEGRKTALESQGEGIPTQPADFDPPPGGVLPEQEPAEVLKPVELESGQAFDLFFLRWSLVVDGVMTALAGLISSGWQIYLVGGLLPLASGSAPAAKGVITEMCPPSKRADAIQAMTLVENVAALSTLALFGYVYATLTELGQAHLTFFCNAGVAIIAVAVLLLSRFPPPGSIYSNAPNPR